MRRFLCFFVLVFSMTGAAWAAPTEEKPIAVLRALDKVTARVEQIEVQAERPYKFGTIFITVHSCRVTPPEETPESAAFLDVSEFKSAEAGEVSIFKGWMFASSPALSAMQHPVYDIWLIGCKDAATPAAQAPAQQPPAAPVPAPAKK